MLLTAQPHWLRPVQQRVVLASLSLLVLATPPLGNVVTVDEGVGRRVQLLESWVGGGGDVAQKEEVHRPLQWNGSTLGALLAALLVSALANSAGVGGGAFFVPLFNVVTGFSVKMSTALSQAVIAGGAVGSTAYALSRRHPLDRKRPLVDFELTLMLTPMLLLGVSAGVLLNVMFPTWAITVCLICLLCYLTSRTLRTGLRLHSMEARLLSMQRSLSLPKPPGADSRAGSRGGSRAASLRAAFGGLDEATAAEALAAPAPEIAAALAEELSVAAMEDDGTVGDARLERSPFLSGSAKRSSSSVLAAGVPSPGAAEAQRSPCLSPLQHMPGSGPGSRSAPSQLGRAASLLSSLSIGSPWRVLESRSSPLDRAGERLGSSFEDDPVGSLGKGTVRIGSSCFAQRELSMQHLPSVPSMSDSQQIASSSAHDAAALQAGSGMAECGDEGAAAPSAAALGGLAAALRAGQGSGGRDQVAGAAQVPGQAHGSIAECAEAATSPVRVRASQQQAQQPATQQTAAWLHGHSELQAQSHKQQGEHAGQPGGWDSSVVQSERVSSLPPVKPGPSPFQRLQVHVSSFDRGSGSPSPRGSGERHGALRHGEAFQAGIHGGDISEYQLDDRRFPWASLAQLLLLWAAFLAFQLAKSRLQRCSWGYALLYVAQAAGAVAASAFYAHQMLRRQAHQQQQHALFGEADLERPILDSNTSTPHSSPRKSASLRQQLHQQQAAQQQEQHEQQAEQQLAPGQALAQVSKLPMQRPSSDVASASGQGTKSTAPAALHHPGAARSNGAPRASVGSHGSKHVWTTGQLGWVLGVVLAGGAVAGLLGIGGGMIVGPLMLELGVHPQASSATSGVMVLFSASVAAVSFAASGRLNVPYAALFGGACLAAAFLGVVVVGRLVKRSGRASLIVLLLAAIMGLGAVLTAVYAGSHAVRDIIHRHNIGFSPLCGT